jgi:hypothetical protein
MMIAGLIMASTALVIALLQFVAALFGFGRLSEYEVALLRDRDAQSARPASDGGGSLAGDGEYVAEVIARLKPRWDNMFA